MTFPMGVIFWIDESRGISPIARGFRCVVGRQDGETLLVRGL